MLHVSFGIALLGATLASGPSLAGDEASRVEGVWRGSSECMVKNSPCQDETNVYRITATAGKPARFSVTASKVVDGKEIVMGPASLWYYDPVHQTLTYAVGNGHFRLKVDGDKMDGDLMLADNTVYRKIHLERVKQ